MASMVFGRSEPLVDGNVARVLLRVEGKEIEAAAGVRWAWERAAELVKRTRRGGGTCGPGVFNEALMELGALVCTPAKPRCGECPLAGDCVAKERGLQEQIPRPKARASRVAVIHSAVLVRDERGRLLVEQRGKTGLWAGMWQAPTLETAGPVSRKKVAEWAGVDSLRPLGRFLHPTTHREVSFVVWDGGCVKSLAPDGERPRKWVRSLKGLAVGNAQRRVLEMTGLLS
jgi:A/G-specific adenine glycosylase